MARIQLGGVVSDIKGSVNGSTYSRCRSGLVLKSKAKQPRSNTIYRNAFLSTSAQVSGAWRNLSATEHNDWNSYANFRNSIKGERFPTLQSGFDLFRSINYFYLLHFGTLFTAPVMLSYDVDPVYVDSIDSTAPAKVVLNRNLVSADEVLFVKMSSAVSPSIAVSASRLKYLGSLQTNNDNFPYDADSIARYGVSPVAGDTVFVAVTVMSVASGFMYPFNVQSFEVI